MLNIRKILLPVVFTDPSTDSSRHLMHQAAWLARRFHAEIILLHVVSPLSYPYGMLEPGHDVTARDLHAQVVQWAQKVWTATTAGASTGLLSHACYLEAIRPAK